ncbi:MAG: nucleotidyltransferase family protein [Defluviitaleaceae bacterium]|nr:nucleotidyltransferase family protein [Defluviitaleaceae bacterium]
MHKAILQAHDLFKNLGIDYAICGGFGLEMFAGRELRTHGDFDIAVFKEDRQKAVQFLLDNGWPTYGRYEEPGTIWQFLFYKINDITDPYWHDLPNTWSIQPGFVPEMFKLDRLQRHLPANADPTTNTDVYSYKPTADWLVEDLGFIELAFDTREGNEYVAQANPRIARAMDKAILYRDGIPYLAPEIILFYKSGKGSMQGAYAKPRTEIDFKAIMPLLCDESKTWLLEAINVTYPDGYEWLDGLI